MMKKILFAAFVALVLTGCGVGNYSVSSGRPDESYISFTAFKKTAVTVCVDGRTYNLKAAKQKGYRKDRDIKQTSLNTITLAPGAHDVKVFDQEGNVVHEHKYNLGSREHRIVDLPL